MDQKNERVEGNVETRPKGQGQHNDLERTNRITTEAYWNSEIKRLCLWK